MIRIKRVIFSQILLLIFKLIGRVWFLNAYWSIDHYYKNLSTIQKNRLAKKVLKNFAYQIAEIAALNRNSDYKFKEVVFENLDTIDKSVNNIILCGHFRNTDLISYALGRKAKVFLIFEFLENSFLRERIKKLRNQFLQAIHWKSLKNSLKENSEGLFIIPSDLKDNDSPYVFPFLGYSFPFPSLGAKMAEEMNLPIYYMDISYRNGKYLASFYEIESISIDQSLNQFSILIEKNITNAPELYNWHLHSHKEMAQLV